VNRAGVLTLCTVALSAAGCGSSAPSGVSPGAYVKSVCTSLRTWYDGVNAASSRLQASGAAATSLLTGKQEYQAFVGSLLAGTKQATTQLEAAGVPAVSDGKQISASIVQAFRQADTGLSSAAVQAANIPTSSAAAYQAGAGGVTAAINSSLAGMTSLSPRKDPQLHAVAAKEPACQALKTGA